jgi:hypothetical protein
MELSPDQSQKKLPALARALSRPQLTRSPPAAAPKGELLGNCHGLFIWPHLDRITSENAAA